MHGAYFYTFPAIRGIQATREYYVSMCPLRLIPRLFLFDEDELAPELRAQRLLNKARVPAICDYILKNPTEYVFSALTVSIDGDVHFEPITNDPVHYNVGYLRIPMAARFVINDGQHRRAAIEAALKERPELGNETIACVFFIDTGLTRCQQMFADLNKYAIRPTHSLSILYDYRDPYAYLAREIVRRVSFFNGMTETEKSTISNRSHKLFTLSGVYRATRELLLDRAGLPLEEQLEVATSYWEEVGSNIDEWLMVKRGEITAARLRKDYVHAHTVTLVALGRVGRALLKQRPRDWQRVLPRLREVNWHRTNTCQWEGRVLVGGRISASHQSLTLLVIALKQILGIPVTEAELAADAAFSQARASS